ncbi:ATPase with role in protein import into the ER [Ceratobasidium sp. 370]|nr:ATPase with role in protein import into the ER [Ceratobasidium sp. 370]
MRLHLAILALAAGPILAGSSEEYGTVVGIDLGTTYSCVAVYQGGRVDIIANDQGNRVTPSWVAFKGKERLIGDPAKQAFHTNPDQTIFDAKRLLGRRFDDTSLREDIRHWPFKVIDNHGRPAVQLEFRGETKTFTPQEISAMILVKLKETAEAYLGRSITHAVITVPAYFNDEQRQATKDAGRIAGLTVLRVLNEPTAAAIAYGLDKSGDTESRMIVYDLGGGTFDVSLLHLNHGVFKVLATAGDTHLGGEDFDNRVIDYLVGRYQKQTAVDVSENKRAMSKLKKEVENAKRVLSSQLTTTLEIESFEGGNDFSSILTRAKFEELNLDLFKQTLEPVSKVLKDTGLESKDIDDILRDFFGGLEPRMGINPDEAVAYGAAIQGSILSGISPFNDDIIHKEVCSYALGVKTAGGMSTQIIHRNAQIPIRKSEIFSTASDNQRTVLIQILQGENILAKDNVLLGTFKLTGILPAARGVPQIEVIFEVDANGILTVVAHDKDGGNKKSITITSERIRLAETDLVRMVHEARIFSQSDHEARFRSATLNELQQKIATKWTLLNDSGHRNQNSSLYAELEGHSRWAETSGGSSSLEELNHRIAQVDNISIGSHTPVPTTEVRLATTADDRKPTTVIVPIPIDLGQAAEAVTLEDAGMPEMSTCANVPLNALLPHAEL